MKAGTGRMSWARDSDCESAPRTRTHKHTHFMTSKDDERDDCEEVKSTSGSRFAAGLLWSVR